MAKFVTFNLRRNKNALIDIDSINPDVILVQEQPEDLSIPSGFVLLTNFGRAAIIIRR